MRLGVGHLVGVLRVPGDGRADLGEHARVHVLRRVGAELRQHLVGGVVHQRSALSSSSRSAAWSSEKRDRCSRRISSGSVQPWISSVPTLTTNAIA